MLEFFYSFNSNWQINKRKNYIDKLKNVKYGYDVANEVLRLLQSYITSRDIRLGDLDSQYLLIFPVSLEEQEKFKISLFKTIHRGILLEIFVENSLMCSTAITSYRDKHSGEFCSKLLKYNQIREFFDEFLKRENRYLAKKFKINEKIFNDLI